MARLNRKVLFPEFTSITIARSGVKIIFVRWHDFREQA